MTTDCKICNHKLHTKADNLILCDHKKGLVHRGCCVSGCSMHGSPCKHAVSEYEKVDLERVYPEQFSMFG